MLSTIAENPNDDPSGTKQPWTDTLHTYSIKYHARLSEVTSEQNTLPDCDT